MKCSETNRMVSFNDSSSFDFMRWLLYNAIKQLIVRWCHQVIYRHLTSLNNWSYDIIRRLYDIIKHLVIWHYQTIECHMTSSDIRCHQELIVMWSHQTIVHVDVIKQLVMMTSSNNKWSYNVIKHSLQSDCRVRFQATQILCSQAILYLCKYNVLTLFKYSFLTYTLFLKMCKWLFWLLSVCVYNLFNMDYKWIICMAINRSKTYNVYCFVNILLTWSSEFLSRMKRLVEIARVLCQ